MKKYIVIKDLKRVLPFGITSLEHIVAQPEFPPALRMSSITGKRTERSRRYWELDKVLEFFNTRGYDLKPEDFNADEV